MQRSLHNDSVLDRALAATHQTAMRISQMHYVNWMIHIWHVVQVPTDTVLLLAVCRVPVRQQCAHQERKSGNATKDNAKGSETK